jgi:hypothetical protein
MKASIIISGQIMGNFTLKNHLRTIDAVKVVNLPFSGFRIEFNSVKDAREAMNSGYRDLKDQCSNVNYSRSAGWLDYDASSAKIVKDR